MKPENGWWHRVDDKVMLPLPSGINSLPKGTQGPLEQFKWGSVGWQWSFQGSALLQAEFWTPILLLNKGNKNEFPPHPLIEIITSPWPISQMCQDFISQRALSRWKAAFGNVGNLSTKQITIPGVLPGRRSLSLCLACWFILPGNALPLWDEI